MKQLLWYNLADMKCPSCYGRIQQKILEPTIACMKCPFKISMPRFEEIIKEMRKPRRKVIDEDENLAELNKL